LKQPPNRFGPLPKADRNSEIQRLSIIALEKAFPTDRFLPRDERTDDFGVDFSLELFSPDGNATNFRAQLQLKGIEKAKPQKDGAISLQIPTSNFNYLLNGPSPLYVLYNVASNQLFYLWARDEQARISMENPNWLRQKSATLHFRHQITPDALDEIYSRIQTENYLYRIEKDNTELQVRHLICKSEDTLNALFEGRLSELPLHKALLVKNEVFSAAQALLSRQSFAGVPYEAIFPDRASFALAHPDARVVGRGKNPQYPYFETLRPPSLEELSRHAPPAIARCATAGTDPAELGIMVGHSIDPGPCNPVDGFIEYLRTKPVEVSPVRGPEARAA
jgi:hypothetical protein